MCRSFLAYFFILRSVRISELEVMDMDGGPALHFLYPFIARPFQTGMLHFLLSSCHVLLSFPSLFSTSRMFLLYFYGFFFFWIWISFLFPSYFCLNTLLSMYRHRDCYNCFRSTLFWIIIIGSFHAFYPLVPILTLAEGDESHLFPSDMCVATVCNFFTCSRKICIRSDTPWSMNIYIQPSWEKLIQTFKSEA